MTNATKKRLHDALVACRAIRGFTDGVAFEDYESDLEKRSAVAYQLAIIGEALDKAVADDPTLHERIPELPRMVGLRNRIMHGYDTVDDAIVWDIVLTKVPGLEAVVAALLDDAGEEANAPAD